MLRHCIRQGKAEVSFAHPNQASHKQAGREAAAKSKKTPAHLRAHLQRLIQEDRMRPRKEYTGRVPGQSFEQGGKNLNKVVRSNAPTVSVTEGPMDPQPDDATSNAMPMPDQTVGSRSSAPQAADLGIRGNGPKTVTAPNSARSGAGIRHAATLRNPNSSRSGPGIVKRVAGSLPMRKAPGINNSLSASVGRNSGGGRPGKSSSSALYGEF